MIPHCSLIYLSLIVSDRVLFHVPIGHLYVREKSVKVFCPFFDWAVCFSDIELYELLIYFGD